VKVSATKWKWFGHAAHLIVGDHCRFHMATLIGDYIVSSVGEYWPERSSREIHAKYHDATWLASNQHRLGDDFDWHYMKKFGYETIGCDRKYETMVFRVTGKMCDCGCGLPKIIPSELDFDSYNDAIAARKGHMELCAKWADPKYVKKQIAKA
jgi:hypothetical protein